MSEDRYSRYDDFAWFYDRYWSRTVPMELLCGVERLLLPHLAPGARILDLCCGTGRVAAALAEQDFRVTGIDGSEQMLQLARRNAPTVEFLAADARSFRLPPSFDGVISLYDSLNHILRLEDLTHVFRNVHAALVPGGRFVFDMNTEESFERNWQGDSFTTVESDHVSIARGTYDAEARLGRFDLTLFRLLDGRWRRADVVISERSYATEEILGALAEAGFGDIALADAATDLQMADHVGRVFFVACR